MPSRIGIPGLPCPLFKAHLTNPQTSILFADVFCDFARKRALSLHLVRLTGVEQTTIHPCKEAFRVSATVPHNRAERRRRNRKRLDTRQRRIARRLEHDQGNVRDEPVMSGSNIDYADRQAAALCHVAASAGACGRVELPARGV